MKVTVVGTGYVGLVAGTCFSSFGINVTCLDNNEHIISKLQNGEVTIHEPGLGEIIEKSIQNKHLEFSTSKEHLNNCDTIIIAVGTPQSDDGSANLNYLNGVIDDIAEHVKSDKTIIIKSTVPVGTANNIRLKLKEKTSGINFNVISNPEFLREGSAVNDFLKPDRIVIGLENKNRREDIEKLYSHLIIDQVPILYTDNSSAELIKYASNCYLAMRLAFLNEISDISEKVKGNIDDIALGMGMDNRIGKHHLKVGPGYGGSCFPKDTHALNYLSSKLGAKSKIIESVIESNERRKKSLALRAYNLVRNIENPTVSILGLTFKSNTDDVRDSSSIDIINFLKSKKINVRVYDPSKTDQIGDYFDGELNLENNIEDAVKDSDLIIICTEWSEFTLVDYNSVSDFMRTKQILDLRNLLEKEKLDGIKYYCLGKK